MTLIDAKKTILSEGEAVYALREAWNELYGVYPSNDSLALLYAQTTLETGRFKSIWCYNFGNIKRSGDEDYCMYRCNEIIKGKVEWFDPPHSQTHFRAYLSATDGAYDYIKFLSQKTRYQFAWEAIKQGNPTAFCHQLKVAGYYTADEAQYTRGVVALTNEFKHRADQLLSWKPTVSDVPSTTPTPIPIPIIFPTIDLDYHPEQENTKTIEVPPHNILESVIRIIESILGSIK